MPDPAPQPLNYQQRTPVLRRIPRIAWITLFLLIVGTLSAYSCRDLLHDAFARREKARAMERMLAIQQACLQYTMRVDMDVLDHGKAWDPGAFGYRPVATFQQGRSYDKGINFRPPLLDELLQATATLPGYGNASNMHWGGVVFMHERRTPSGEAVLIIGMIYAEPFPPREPRYDIRFFCFIPATATSPPRFANNSYTTSLWLGEPLDGRLQVQSGQPDPQDPSHFVLPVRTGSHDVELHGWLQDDFALRFRASEGAIVQDGLTMNSATFYAENPAWVAFKPGTLHIGLK